MTIMTEGNYLGDLVKRESDLGNEFSREVVTVKDGESLSLGSVIGKIKLGDVTVAAGTNAGGGTCTKDATTPLLSGAQAGGYRAVCITAASGGGTFRVSDPKGNVLGDVAVGATFANQIKFAIADGTPDFAVGDSFTLTVAEGSGKCVEVDAAAVDGSQDAYGFSTDAYAPSGADMEGVAIVRDAVIDPAYLAWPTGATNAQKSAWLAQLKDRNILSDRPSA